jgi:beta-phosphoglucomutase-like phosphatase (HAD superfamily)
MRKFEAVLFDMDGVLIDAREWHYLALNEALAPFGYQISEEDHQSRFDGLSTRRKLQILSEEEGLPTHLHALISNVKQDRTLRFSSFFNYPSVGLQILLSRLSQKKITTGVVTNSIRETTEVMLSSAGIINHFETIVTNEDVKFPKPDPSGYSLACKNLGIEPDRVLVIEDGDYGAKAASDAGCKVIRVSGPNDVNIGLLLPLLPELL